MIFLRALGFTIFIFFLMFIGAAVGRSENMPMYFGIMAVPVAAWLFTPRTFPRTSKATLFLAVYVLAFMGLTIISFWPFPSLVEKIAASRLIGPLFVFQIYLAALSGLLLTGRTRLATFLR